MALFQTRDFMHKPEEDPRGGGGGVYGSGVRFEGVVTLLWEVFDIKNDIIR